MDAFSIIDLKKRGWHIRTKNTNSTKKKTRGAKRSDSFLYQSQHGDEGDEGKKAMSSSVLADMYNSDEDARGEQVVGSMTFRDNDPDWNQDCIVGRDGAASQNLEWMAYFREN